MTSSSYDEHLKKIKAAQAGNVAADIAALYQAKDAEAKIYTDNYNQQIADTAQSYENAFRQNELQRDLNERYLERKAAEMGLTDSGMNRTQLTANQLSYANQKGNLTMQKQKAVDTLASALQAKIAGVEAEKVTGAQQIRSSYDSAASEQATILAKADIEAQADYSSNLYKAKDDLLEKLRNEDIPDQQKQIYVDNYLSQYGMTPDIETAIPEKIKVAARGKLGSIFYSNRYSDKYKVAAFVDYVDKYGVPSPKLVEGLVYASGIPISVLEEAL